MADFGLSRVSSGASVRRYGLSLPGGTVTHIAPERYRDPPYGEGDERSELDLARKSDVYSYGVVLWEIREKERPYKG